MTAIARIAALGDFGSIVRARLIGNATPKIYDFEPIMEAIAVIISHIKDKGG